MCVHVVAPDDGMRTPPPVVLTNAMVVHHDRIEQRDLSFAAGRVVADAPRDAHVIDLDGYAIYPGFVNAHDHLQLNSIPRLSHDRPFADSAAWIEAYELFMHEAHVAESIRIPLNERAFVGGYKNLLAGVTTVAHHDPMHEVFNESFFPVRVLTAFGWAHSLALASASEAVPKYGPGVADSYARTPSDWPWIIHLAEGTSHRARAELQQLLRMNCLRGNTVLVHGVGLSHDDQSKIIGARASVIWCPSSNIEMLGATLNPERLFAARRLALGTDSRLTGSRDLLDEIRLAAEHSSLDGSDLLRLVTEDASSVLRLPGAGTLEPGGFADCVIVRTEGNLHDALLSLSRRDVCAVMRDGSLAVADDAALTAFASLDVDTVPFVVDGQRRHMRREYYRPDSLALEPGVDLEAGTCVS